MEVNANNGIYTEQIGFLKNLADQSPMFNLSLSSLELFHSNFLHWLITLYGYQMALCLFGKNLIGTEESPVISKREKRQIDLEIRIGDIRTIFIENKFKSLPNRSQLEGYQTMIEKRISNPTILLLYLDVPGASHALKGITCEKITYNQITDRLDEAVKSVVQNEYHRKIIEDYISYVRTIIKIMKPLEKEWRDSKNFLEHSKDGLYNLMLSYRLHDFYDKHRYGFLTENIDEKLQSRWPGSKQVTVATSFTRGTGISDIWINIPELSGCSLVIQIQSNSLKLMVNFELKERRLDEGDADSIKPIGKTERKLIISKIDDLGWFSFGKIRHTGKVFPKDPKKFNKYGAGMKYRRVELEPYSVKELLDVVTRLVRRGLCIANRMHC